MDFHLAQAVAAAAGFLLAVLWFDLMFDVQLLAHRRAPEVPEPVVASIATYYRRVTTTASPMGNLVAVAMVVLIGALIAQAAAGDTPIWVSVISLSAAAIGIGLAAVRIFGDAQRLGGREDPPAKQSELARGIFKGHVVCLMAIATLLVVQLAAA